MNFSYSVVIPAYNAVEWLEETVASVLDQTLSAEHIVIVDDGSTDETWGLCQRLSGRHPQVSALKQENQGPSVARNRGFEELRSDFVAFLDADDLWRPSFAETAVAELKDGPRDLFIARARRFQNQVEDLDEDYGPSEAYAREAPQSILSGIPFAPCMVMLRSALFKRVGGFRGGDVYWEDWDLWIRLAEAGARFLFDLEQPLADYRRSPDSRSSDAVRCFRKSLATLELHWHSSLASVTVKRRAKARFLRYIGKNLNKKSEKMSYFFRAFWTAPWDWRNMAILVSGLLGHRSSYPSRIDPLD